jgi:DNA-binding response OmpR family regulator
MTDVLIVEDNSELAALSRDFVRKAGYSCEVVVSGEEALRFAQTNEVGIVLLDIMLPGIDGFAVCDALHKTQNMPIIVLSARTEKDDKLSALTLGADDYIEKPFDIDLLLAKIAALYRRTHEKDRTALVLGDFFVDVAKRQVLHGDKALTLAAKEYDLLLLLMENEGKTLRKEYLFSQVWGSDSFSEPSTLTVHIKWLREKIEHDPKNPQHILTVWGVGYRFDKDGRGA